ncbi:unannotated protein [freshwater metagenome]|uniref:Unannotated protein n=1 Tax=freshwater metagenome TaxID=449393 RepID=A0A6J5ZNY5_9ZZZZ
MTVFFTICALTRPRTSVRKSSSRSDHRKPPRATGANRRCMPSMRGEKTQISNIGTGSGKSGTMRGLSLNTKTGFSSPLGSRWYAFVRIVARTSATLERIIRSWSRLATALSASSMSETIWVCDSCLSPANAGSNRARKSASNCWTMPTLARNTCCR